MGMRKNQRPCPQCGNPMHRQSRLCMPCSRADPAWRQKVSEQRKGRPSYERTPEHRAHLSGVLTGRKKPDGWRSASTRPEIAAKIQAWWTPERREAKRQEELAKNPEARYHGLSAKEAARRVAAVGTCQNCGHDGSGSRLDIHHKDRNKRNQSPENLIVLCHRCHMREHAQAQETGWDRYHQRRRQTLDA